MLPSASRYAVVLAVLRIFTGIAWLSHGLGKIRSPKWAAPGGSFEAILKDMSSGTSGVYHDFVYGLVLPHSAVFATLVAWGETLTGVALALGLLTRVGGVVGAFLALNYSIAGGDFTDWTSIGGLNLVFVALSAVNIALPTGLVAGLDGVIARRRHSSTLGEKS